MLPINLLPSSYGNKDNKRNAFIGMIVLTAATAGVVFYFYTAQMKELDAAKQEKTTADNFKTQYDAEVKKINDVKAKISATETKQTFIANAQKYNDAWPATFDLVRALASPGGIMSQTNVWLKEVAFLDASHKTLRITGFATTEDAMARWWKALKNRNDIFDNVRFEFLGRPFNPGGGTNAGGVGGSAGMLGGPMSGGPVAGSAPMAAAPGSFGVPGSPGMGGMGGGRTSDSVGPGTIEGRPVYNFVATLVLKQPMDGGAAAPTWTGSGATAAPAPGGAPAGFPTSSGGPAGGGSNDPDGPAADAARKRGGKLGDG